MKQVKFLFIGIYLFPRNISIFLLRMYRRIISPLYGEVCRYYPSCSHYSLLLFQEHGFLKSILLTSLRILRCHPWAEGGIDDIPQRKRKRFAINSMGFVVCNSNGR